MRRRAIDGRVLATRPYPTFVPEQEKALESALLTTGCLNYDCVKTEPKNSGKLFERAFSGAAALAEAVNAHKFACGEKLNIVAHSQGGNAAKAFTEMGLRYADTLITMGTPQRYDFKVAYGSVGNYLNVSSKFDVFQKMGGSWVTLGRAGRTNKCAVNVGVDRAPGVGKVGHSDLHTPQGWREMEKWLCRAGYGLQPENVNGGCWGQRDFSLPSHSSKQPMLGLSVEEELW